MGAAIDTVMDDPDGPLWLAATLDNRYPDVWGSAYLVALNLSTAARRQAAMDEMVANPSKYFEAGQVRSMPFPTLWTRCDFSPAGRGKINPAGCAANGTYQVRTYTRVAVLPRVVCHNMTCHGGRCCCCCCCCC